MIGSAGLRSESIDFEGWNTVGAYSHYFPLFLMLTTQWRRVKVIYDHQKWMR